MVFDTRTVDTMKESLAHYFDISCEELVEFIRGVGENPEKFNLPNEIEFVKAFNKKVSKATGYQALYNSV